MRSFFAISLALITGCGDNLAEPSDPATENGDLTAGVEDDGIIPRLIPGVCASRAWPEALVEAKDSDVAVVPMTHGAAVFAVPKSGGDLRGFLVDGRGLIMGDPTGTKIIGGNFTGVSATVTDGRVIVGLVDGSNVAVNVVRDDLGDFRALASVAGSYVGDSTIMHARGERITATGGATGMVLSTFDSQWASVGSELLARSVPTGMTTTAYGNDAMVAWTTATGCHLQRVASGIHSEQSFPCTNARVAADYGSRAGQLVYQDGGDILLSNIEVSSHNEIANQLMLAPGGTAPRIVFDGARYWVSYTNIHNDIVVGYLDDKNNLVSTAIEGMRPMQDAYELAFVNGAIWVYGIDETGFNASKLCLTRE
ncbi:MAG: hypothetical protein H0T42_31620 [Deltaproteobacteria bacterium]|nr:hypothetical protein [Deltaproteobacteria bacterium]